MRLSGIPTHPRKLPLIAAQSRARAHILVFPCARLTILASRPVWLVRRVGDRYYDKVDDFRQEKIRTASFYGFNMG